MTSGGSQPASSCAMASAAITADCFWSAGNFATSRSIFLYACSDNSIVFASNIDARLAVNLTKHDILRADDGYRVGNHMAFCHLIQPLQMREARRTDFQSVRFVGTIR